MQHAQSFLFLRVLIKYMYYVLIIVDSLIEKLNKDYYNIIRARL